MTERRLNEGSTIFASECSYALCTIFEVRPGYFDDNGYGSVETLSCR